MDRDNQYRKAKAAGVVTLIAGLFLVGGGILQISATSQTAFYFIGIGLILLAHSLSPASLVKPISRHTTPTYSLLSRALFIAAGVTLLASTIYFWGSR